MRTPLGQIIGFIIGFLIGYFIVAPLILPLFGQTLPKELSPADSLELRLEMADQFLNDLMEEARILIPVGNKVDTVDNFRRLSRFVYEARAKNGGRFIASLVPEGIRDAMVPGEKVIRLGEVTLYRTDPITKVERFQARLVMALVINTLVKQS